MRAGSQCESWYLADHFESSHRVALSRGRIKDLALWHAFLEFLAKPVACLGVAVGQHYRARFGLDGVIGEFFAVGVPAEVKLFNRGPDWGAVFEGVEIEMGGFGVGEELSAGGVRIVVSHEADAVFGVGQEGRCGFVGGGVFHHHATAEEVDPLLREVASGAEVEFEGLDAHSLQHLQVEVNQAGLFADFIKVIAEVHPESGGEDRATGEASKVAGLVDDLEEFLHATEGKDRNEATASAFEDRTNGIDKAVDLSGAGGFGATGFGAPGGFEHKGVDFPGGEVGAGEGTLCFKQDIATEDDAAVLVDQFHRSGTDHVSGGVEDDFDLILALGMDFAAFKALPVELTGKDGDLAVVEEGEFRDAVFLALAFHDVDGIAQHTGGEEGVGEARNDGGVGIAGRHERHGAEVVEVAMGQDDEIDGSVGDGSVFGQSVLAHHFGVESGIYENVEIAEADEMAIGSDPAMAVEVDEFHEWKFLASGWRGLT